MKKIIVKKGSVGEKMIREAHARKEESKRKMREKFPPEEMMKRMSEKVKEVDKLNKGTLDKSTFQLGMMCMWLMMNEKSTEG